MPCSTRSAGARLVSTVTPSSLSALSPRPRTAAASVFLSSACTVRNATPMRAIAAVARSTVASMSSSLASTNTGTSRRASSCASAKPSREQQLEPDLVDADAVAERLDQRFGLFDARHVERHDQSVAGKRHGTTKLFGGDGERLDHSGAEFLLRGVLETAVGLERVHRARHGDLLRNDRRADADLEDLAEMQQTAHRPVIAGRGAGDGEHARLVDFEPGLALGPHPASPSRACSSGAA